VSTRTPVGHGPGKLETGRVWPPSTRTFRRVFAKISTDALNQALYGFLEVMPPAAPGELPEVTRHQREQRPGCRGRASPRCQRGGAAGVQVANRVPVIDEALGFGVVAISEVSEGSFARRSAGYLGRRAAY
jgi:hypothetical protein